MIVHPVGGPVLRYPAEIPMTLDQLRISVVIPAPEDADSLLPQDIASCGNPDER